MTDTHAQTAPQTGAGTAATVRVWDPLVRIVHWSLVAAFAVAWLSADELDTLHEVAGYGVAGLVAMRLVWGLIGSRHARFSRFVKGPRKTLTYLGDMSRGRERRYLGHNPAGAAMIVALLVTLSGTAVTGWLMAEPDRIAMLPSLPAIVAPAWADGDGDAFDARGDIDETLEEVHEALANLLLVLAALHVGGVALASVRHHENLTRAMFTGKKRAPGPGDIV
ncbi:cytochrome b/b6 domain-containing protein [Marivita sp. S2033]|uniref:cytochrome b/b6 domain-containing protein n=1 Tax=Marivita sp. S2033 TaxID=3373187 RepID=UPI00398245C9